MPRECLVCVICYSNSFHSFNFIFCKMNSHIEDVHLLFFMIFLGLLILDIVKSAPPLECLYCVICNSNSLYSFLFKPCIPLPGILKMCTFYFCAALIYIFSYFFSMLNLDILLQPQHIDLHLQHLWGTCFYIICNTNSFHSFYTNNLIEIPLQVACVCVCVGGGGQLIYIVSPMSIYNQYFGDACPEQSLVLFQKVQNNIRVSNNLDPDQDRHCVVDKVDSR